MLRGLPDCTQSDPGPTEVERAESLCLSCQVTHGQLQVFLCENLVCNVELLQCLTPQLCHQVKISLQRWQPDVTVEVLTPEQALQI